MVSFRRQRLVLAVVILAVLLFNFPVLALVDSLAAGSEFPLLPAYIFMAWGGVILAAWLAMNGGARG